jgi:hypothetical protein
MKILVANDSAHDTSLGWIIADLQLNVLWEFGTIIVPSNWINTIPVWGGKGGLLR